MDYGWNSRISVTPQFMFRLKYIATEQLVLDPQQFDLLK